jgi:uncharacterized protein (DUF486 family)
MRTIILLTISNIFMTFAWYGHLKYRTSALWKVILVSWGIAFFEYCFQVPANRIGSYEFNTAQLKTIQEVITLSVFLRVLCPLSRRETEVESRRGLWLYRNGRVFRFPQVVSAPEANQRVNRRGCHTTTSWRFAKCSSGFAGAK